MKRLIFKCLLLSCVCIIFLQASCGNGEPKENSNPTEVKAEKTDTASIVAKWSRPEISFDEMTLEEYQLSSDEKRQLKMMLGAVNAAIESLTIEFFDDHTYVTRMEQKTVFGGYELKSDNQRLRLRPEGEPQHGSIEIKEISSKQMKWRIQNFDDFLGDKLLEMNEFNMTNVPTMNITFSR